MTYGFNDPRGFIPKYFSNGNITSPGFSTTNGPNSFIASGYGTNIGIGDAVCLQDGYIINAADVGTVSGNTKTVTGAPIWGTFMGCSYDNNNDSSVLYPDQPNLLAWKAGTVLPEGQYASAYVTPVPYGICYTIQVGSQGATIPAIGRCAALVYQLDDSGQVIIKNNQSTAYINVGSGSGFAYDPQMGNTGYSSVFIVGFDNTTATTYSTQSQINLPYGNLLVTFGNTAFPQFTGSLS